jgi:hypothetical protein
VLKWEWEVTFFQVHSQSLEGSECINDFSSAPEWASISFLDEKGGGEKRKKRKENTKTLLSQNSGFLCDGWGRELLISRLRRAVG